MIRPWRRGSRPGRQVRFRRMLVAFELAVAVVAVLGGAALIGRWALGLATVLVGVAFAADAVFRDDGQPMPTVVPIGGKSHEAILDEYRRAR